MSIGIFSGSAFRSLLLACVATPLIGGCAPDAGTAAGEQALVSCPAPPPNVVFFDSFENGLSQWPLIECTTPASDGHCFATDNKVPVYAGQFQLRSDPAGQTATNHGAHIQSVAINLSGRKHAQLTFHTRYSLFCNDMLAVYASNGTITSELAELHGHNQSYPGFDPVIVDLSRFDGSSQVFLSFFLNTGSGGVDFGAAIDNVEVTADPVQLPMGVAFMETWQNGLDGWMDQSSPFTNAGHRWTVMPLLDNPMTCPMGSQELRSDPVGMTAPGDHARLLSPAFSLAGASHAKLIVRTRYHLANNDYFAISATDGVHVNEVSELHQFNGNFPGADIVTADLSFYAGQPSVHLIFDLLTSGVDFGAAVESVQVVTN